MVHRTALSHDPQVELYEDFLSADECAALVRAAGACDMQRSPTVGDAKHSAARTSTTCFLDRGADVCVALLDRVARALDVPRERCERPQVARYRGGELYRAHHDTVADSDPNWRAFEARGGHRTHTVLVYLNDVRAGGQTRFPKLDLAVVPVRGRALVFRPSRDARLDARLLHEAQPPAPGHDKWVCQVWVRERRAV